MLLKKYLKCEILEVNRSTSKSYNIMQYQVISRYQNLINPDIRTFLRILTPVITQTSEVLMPKYFLRLFKPSTVRYHACLITFKISKNQWRNVKKMEFGDKNNLETGLKWAQFWTKLFLGAITTRSF